MSVSRVNCPWLLKEQHVTDTIERLRRDNHDFRNKALVANGEIERLKGQVAHLEVLLGKRRPDD